jgi:hypothetical protein
MDQFYSSNVEDLSIVPREEFQEVVNLLRKGEIVLWAGSGLSLCAGYPTSDDIIETIMSKVPQDQKYFFKESSLKEIAEEYETLFDRTQLNEILIELFRIEPKSQKYHEILPLIPQLKSIITTNYDTLFERVYGDLLKVIVTNEDVVASKNKQRIQLLKIHGTIEQPETIRITTSDYQAFFNEEQSRNPLWTEIKSLCTKNSILFIGYSLKDSDVKYLIYQILDQLKDSHKEIFLISPDVPEHTIRDLNKKYQITYINKSGEEALSELISEIDKHLIVDFSSGLISTEDYQLSLKLRGLVTTVTRKTDGNIIALNTSIESEQQKPTGVKYQIDDEALRGKFQDFLAGKSDTTFEISSENTKGRVSFSFEDTGFQFPDYFDRYHVTITHQPQREYRTTIRIKGTDISFPDLVAKVYRLNAFLISRITHPQFEITIKIHQKNREKSKLSIKYNWDRSPIRSYPILKMLHSWVSGNDLIILNQETGKQFSIPIKNVGIPKDEIERIKAGFNFLSDLIKIQDYFGISFQNIDEISEEDFQSMRLLLGIISNTTEYTSFVSATLESYDTALFSKMLNEESPLLEINGKKDIHLFSQAIPIKSKVIITDAYIENAELIQQQIQKGVKEINIIIKSRLGDIPIIFDKS